MLEWDERQPFPTTKEEPKKGGWRSRLAYAAKKGAGACAPALACHAFAGMASKLDFVHYEFLSVYRCA